MSRPKGRKSKPSGNGAESRRAQLVAAANANPNAFFTLEENGIICGFGRNAMTALASAGAPVAFRKMNPRLLVEWIANNQELIRKIRSVEDEK